MFVNLYLYSVWALCLLRKDFLLQLLYINVLYVSSFILSLRILKSLLHLELTLSKGVRLEISFVLIFPVNIYLGDPV